MRVGIKRTTLGAVLAGILGGLLLGSAAYACTNPGLYFDGAVTAIISTQGSQAKIDHYDPRMCLSSSAWAMMDNQSNSNELAQIGWLKLSGWSTSTVYFFYEYGQSGQLYMPISLGAVPHPTNSSIWDQFTVYTNGNGVTLFIIDGVGQARATLNWTANNAQWFGETHSYSDQTPGDTNNHVYFTDVQHLYNGVWYNDTASVNKYNRSPYGSGTWPNSNYFEIWDTRYSSEG